MAEIAELIERLQKATGPSRELDAAIALRLGWMPDGSMEVLRWTSPDTKVSRSGPPPYTASIDAALTLVPDECDYLRFLSDPSGCGWVLGRFHLSHPDEAERFRRLGEGVTGGHFAIALCIAALKARMALTTAKGGGNEG